MNPLPRQTFYPNKSLLIYGILSLNYVCCELKGCAYLLLRYKNKLRSMPYGQHTYYHLLSGFLLAPIEAAFKHVVFFRRVRKAPQRSSGQPNQPQLVAWKMTLSPSLISLYCSLFYSLSVFIFLLNVVAGKPQRDEPGYKYGQPVPVSCLNRTM